MEVRYQFTDGRISTSSSRRGPKLSVDALLRAVPSLPIAIVHGRRASESYEHAVRILRDTAQRMALPFAYLLEQNGRIQEFDWSHSSHAHQPVMTQLDTFPTREALLERWMQALQLTAPKEIQTLRYPYYQMGKKPRYYQEADFFEVIVIDECHRGSAQETSEWRKVLKHFSSAVQIGLTATPLSTDTVQTDEYVGSPLYQYSLHMGINDGFLAPYRVRRVHIDSVSIDSVDAGADSSHPHPTQERDESVPTDNRQNETGEIAQDDDGERV